MNVYEVTLADRRDGAERSIRVKARDQDHAREQVFAAQPGAMLKGEPSIVEIGSRGGGLHRVLGGVGIACGGVGLLIPLFAVPGLIVSVIAGNGTGWENGRMGTILCSAAIIGWALLLFALEFI